MSKASPEKTKKQDQQYDFSRLHVWNIRLAVLYALQAGVILLLSTTKLFPVQTTYLTQDPIATELAGHPVITSATRHLWDVNLAYLVAAFLLIAAVGHILVATLYRPQYEAGLQKGSNPVRWFSYALSGGTMLFAIAVLSGIADLATLGMIFASTILTFITGLMIESRISKKEHKSHLACAVAVIAGLVPWLVVGWYLWSASVYGGGHIPAFVYWMAVIIFVCFASISGIVHLELKQIGKWAQYAYAERAFMILSLVTGTALAWQLFMGALKP